MRSAIDAAAGGTLTKKMKDETYNLIEEIALNLFNGPPKEANLSGLEVSLKLMHLLWLLQR